MAYEINGEGIPEDGTIGVVVSGGFDSSLLWHIVYGICKDRGQKIIPFTVPKNDGALRHADIMLHHSQMAYGGKRLHPFVINAEGVDWMRTDYLGEEVAVQLKDGIVEIFRKGYADYVFTGVNAYPPHYEELCEYHTPGPRNLSRDSDFIWKDKPASHWILQPFADLTKADLVQMAEQLGCLEDIASYSHSCVEQVRGRCGVCFWCKEREWGFAEAGIIDNGKN